MADSLITLQTLVYRQIQMMRVLVGGFTAQASVVVPIQPASDVTGGTQVLMYHDRLPPMVDVELGGTTYNGHHLSGDIVYTCVPQAQGGRLWMVGESGLFSVGAKRWFTSQASYDESVRVTLVRVMPTGEQVETPLIGTQNVQLFLEQGTSMFLQYVYIDGVSPSGHDEIDILEPSEFVITRLSRAPASAPVVPP